MEKMKRTAKKVGLHERSSDFAFWQSQPWTARLEALEEIRREYARGYPPAGPADGAPTEIGS